MEGYVNVKSLALVPLAFVYAHHFAGLARDAIVGKHVRRIGKNHIYMILGKVRHQSQTIALEKAKARFAKNRANTF